MAEYNALGSEKLKGDDKLKRILELTYFNTKNKETSTNTKAEYIKESNNGGVYGIIKEKDGYYVKKGLNESSLEYIGGMFMKNKNKFKSYAEALKRLDLGLETRMSSKVGLLSGGQRQALTLLMATLQKPKILLLDEHTAALDPRTAKKVLDLTEEIVTEQKLTALMVTHNMKDAIAHGNRLIMMHEGKIIYDVAGEEKKNLKVADLLAKFEEVSGGEFANDRMMLS